MDATPCSEPEMDWDPEDPPLPKPTPPQSPLIIDPEDENFMDRFLDVTKFDPVYLIRLLRTFAPPELDVQDSDVSGKDVKPRGGNEGDWMDDEDGEGRSGGGMNSMGEGPVDHNRSLEVREDAGRILVDLCADHNNAAFFIRNHILKVILAVVDKSLKLPEESRLVENGVSMLANMAEFNDLNAKLVAEPFLREILTEQVAYILDSDVLVQLCRLLQNGLVKEGKNEWMAAVASSQFLKRLLWTLDNTLNDTLIEQGFRLVETFMSNHESTIGAFLELGILDLFMKMANCYVLRETGGEADATMSPGLLVTVARDMPALSGESVVSVIRALYASTASDTAVEAIRGHENLLLCLYHLWIVSEYDQLDDQLLLVLATLNQPLMKMVESAEAIGKLLQVWLFDLNSHSHEVQLSAIWAVLSYVSRGLLLESQREDTSTVNQLSVIARDVSKLTTPNIPASCVEYARCSGLNLIAAFDAEVNKIGSGKTMKRKESRWQADELRAKFEGAVECIGRWLDGFGGGDG